MTFLILAIISSTINHLLFKAFARFRVNLLTALVINYAVCVFIGYGSSFNTLFSSSYFWQGWYPFSILQGGIFVACLFFMGQTTANHGVAVASLATRLSVAIPTFSSFFLYHDIATMPKVIGILLTLLALYFSSIDPKNPSHQHGILSLLPISLFLVFGAHSTLAKFVQHHFLVTTSYHAYVMSAFFSAFLISGLILVRKLIRKQHSFHRKDLVSGLALGFSNYGSVYFLIRALSVPGRQSSQLFPTISITIVGLSSLDAWIIFKERFHRGIFFAFAIGTVSLILVNF